jgi:hypothetical protein
MGKSFVQSNKLLKEVMKRQAILIVHDAVRAVFTGAIGVALGVALGLTVIRIFTWISFSQIAQVIGGRVLFINHVHLPAGLIPQY